MRQPFRQAKRCTPRTAGRGGERSGRAHDQIVGTEGQASRERAVHHQPEVGCRSHGHSVSDIRKHNHAIEQVIAVRPTAGDMQK